MDCGARLRPLTSRRWRRVWRCGAACLSPVPGWRSSRRMTSSAIPRCQRPIPVTSPSTIVRRSTGALRLQDGSQAGRSCRGRGAGGVGVAPLGGSGVQLSGARRRRRCSRPGRDACRVYRGCRRCAGRSFQRSATASWRCSLTRDTSRVRPSTWCWRVGRARRRARGRGILRKVEGSADGSAWIPSSGRGRCRRGASVRCYLGEEVGSAFRGDYGALASAYRLQQRAAAPPPADAPKPDTGGSIATRLRPGTSRPSHRAVTRRGRVGDRRGQRQGGSSRCAEARLAGAK